MTDNRVFLPPPILKPAVRPTVAAQADTKIAPQEERDFAAYLAEAQGLQVSRHAQERLSRRQIPLTVETWGAEFFRRWTKWRQRVVVIRWYW